MKVLLLLVVAVASQAFGKDAASIGEQRYIQDGPTRADRRWVDASEVAEWEAGRKPGRGKEFFGKGFFDLTNMAKEFAEPHGKLKSAEDSFAANNNPPVVPIPKAVTQKSVWDKLVGGIAKSSIVATDTLLSDTNIFYTRYYRSESGTRAALWMRDQLDSLAMQTPGNISTELVYNTYSQPSVIARIAGNGKAEGRVVLGSHIDSIGRTSTGKSPGADDDGSGSSCNFEVFKTLANAVIKGDWAPQRTLEFHFYSGEEGGLLGSNQIAKRYQEDFVTVETMLQLDMTGYGDPATVPIGIIRDYTSAELSDFVSLLVSTYSSLKQVDSKCGYACSDHASWTKYGYRSAFPFETSFGAASNPHIHSGDDELKYLNADRMTEFAKMALGYVLEMDAAQ